MAEYLLKEEMDEISTALPVQRDKRQLGGAIDKLINTEPESLMRVADMIRHAVPPGARIVFVSGNFNVLHPGHLRLLNFAAECGDFLVVGVNSDQTNGVLIPETLRLKGIRSIDCVNLALILPVTADQFIGYLKPDIVVKGSEHEQLYNPEQVVLDDYGGKLLFSSGEMRFSSLELLRSEIQGAMHSAIKKPQDYLLRHGISPSDLPAIARRFADINVVVIGDLIIDEYITCDPLGLSREDPTIVVTPIKRDVFVGGAGIVAAHARALGAKVKYYSVAGGDEIAGRAKKELGAYQVDAFLMQDTSRPTTLKQRFRADGKTLLRVSHLRHHHIDSDLSNKLYKQISRAIKEANLLVFSDFNYGCLPQHLVDSIIDLCLKYQVPMVADSQSSSQIGDVSRFHDMLLITPTEHEARLAVRDQSSGLIVLADKLSQKANARHVFITLASEGLMVHSPDSDQSNILTDQLPAFNTAPKDVSGGGDTLLITSSLALAAGATIWQSAYLGSVAAACHVARIGNQPLSINELLQELYL